MGAGASSNAGPSDPAARVPVNCDISDEQPMFGIVTHVTNSKGLTAIPDNFLCNKSAVQVVKFDATFTSITHIGDNFLAGCPKLELVDLSLLTGVSSIGNACFSGSNPKAVLVPIAPLQIVSVGDDFLRGCSHIEYVDLRYFAPLTRLGANFFAGCTGLKTLDVSPLVNLQEIGNGFLDGCSGVLMIDFAPFNQRKIRLGDGFMRGCTGLTAFDPAPLAACELGAEFLAGTPFQRSA